MPGVFFIIIKYYVFIRGSEVPRGSYGFYYVFADLSVLVARIDRPPITPVSVFGETDEPGASDHDNSHKESLRLYKGTSSGAASVSQQSTT